MPHAQPQPSSFTSAPVGQVLLRTAAPIILVMTLSGSLNLVDAAFVGWYVGPPGVAAVSASFPVFAVIIALSTMVSSGMASQLARRLGAQEIDAAQKLFSSAHGLALAMAAALALVFACVGAPLTGMLSGGDPAVSAMAWRYLAILIGAGPVIFCLSLHVDGLRSEGRAMMMAGLSVLVTLVNIGLNYLLIGMLGLGVAGSALGTAAAQALALALVLILRGRIETPLPRAALLAHPWHGGWARILTLGAPLSLNFIGLALIASLIIAAIQIAGSDTYLSTIAAYGLLTRLIGFAFLPLMGLAQAMQAVVGNNVGAGLPARSDRALLLALIAAFAYCAAVEAIFIANAPRLGALFLQDAAIISELGRILRPIMTLYALTGPILILGLYFQAIGDAGRAALLTLSKPYALQPPLILLLVLGFGEPGIWLAVPAADLLLATLALILCLRLRRPGQPGFALPAAPA